MSKKVTHLTAGKGIIIKDMIDQMMMIVQMISEASDRFQMALVVCLDDDI